MRTFRGDRQIVGKAILLRGEPYTVVGVMPRGFRAEKPADVWTPLRPSRTGEGEGDNYGVIARLKPGVSWAEASGQLKALSSAMRPRWMPKTTVFEERIVPLQRGMAYEIRYKILAPWAGALIVLLIGCANIAGLLLAQAAMRRREVATRLALGASRWAIVRELLTESVLLAVAGGAAGVVLGVYGVHELKLLGATTLQLWYPIVLDGRVLLVMAAVALATTLFFGLVPALETARVDVRSVLVENDRAVAGGRGWLRSGLIVCEIALSLVLLVSAGLLVRTLLWLEHQDAGFDPRHVMTAQTSLNDARYQTAASVNALYRKGLEEIRRIPGVESAAVALTLPYQRPLNSGFRIVGEKSGHAAETIYVTPGYFEALKMRVVSGRAFRDGDTANAQKVTVVSAAFANKYLQGARNALGRQVAVGDTVFTVAGVIQDVQQHSGLGDFGPISISPTIYVPVTQVADTFMGIHIWFSPSWVVRSTLAPGDLSAKLNRAIASVDPQLPVANFQSMDELRRLSTQDERYQAALFGSVAGLALLLSIVGLYGIVSRSVVQRTREIGIRMALGAAIRDAIATVMKPGLAYACAGLILGLLLSIASARLLAHLVWGVPLMDPLTFVVAGVLLVLCTALATLIPALRVTRIDPAQTLREE